MHSAQLASPHGFDPCLLTKHGGEEGKSSFSDLGDIVHVLNCAMQVAVITVDQL